jgi:N-acetylglucosaminyl-diphospho-decaprenol L-rhamnosyltransferase
MSTRPACQLGDGNRLPDVSVVVVSYNVRDLLEFCLASLERGSSNLVLEVVVVDNGSTDGSAEMVRRRFPNARMIECPENPGYGGAINRGAAVARGRYLLMLNPDTEIRDGAIQSLADVLESNLDVAVAGPRLRFPNGSTQSSRRRFPTPITALLESTLAQRWWPRSPELFRYYVGDRPDERQDVDWLVGACLLVRRITFEAVGGFDERFTMYSEELDLCHRIRDVGFRTIYEPSAEVTHHEGRSSEQNLAQRSRQFTESKARYFEKYFGTGVGIAVRIALLANTVFELTEESAKLLIRHRPDLRQERIRALLAVAADQLTGMMRASVAPRRSAANNSGVSTLSSATGDTDDTLGR